MDEVKTQLIDEAQRLIQKMGYNGFSYRDVAAKVGIRSAEASSLPDMVAMEARKFFDQNLAWLSAVFARLPKRAGVKSPDAEAELFLSTLEGALLVAKGKSDTKVFDQITKAVLARYG